jgi:uncharacterized membrane protein YfcA
MPSALIAAIVFLAALVQSLSGFGFALMVMPLVTMVIGLHTAAPLVALVGLTLNTVNFVRYRRAANIREVVRLTLASLLGVPAGVWALANVNEALILRLMGLILIAYTGYALLRPAASRLISPRWVYPAGFVAGFLGGAYNTPAPPVIVYGALRGWPKEEYRAVLHGLFCFNGVLVVVSHAVAQHMTGEVLTSFLYTVPPLLLGVLFASRMDSRLNRDRFRKLVTVMTLLLGFSLAIGVG